MENTPLEIRELFHLHFLRQLSQRLQGRSWAVKGGICLRFFHRSPRFSQDMDLDVLPQVEAGTLQNAVDQILDGRSLPASLGPFGVARLRISRPKQTPTTQRWKVALVLSEETALPTKVEFSRRRKTLPYTSGLPDAELLRRYRLVPFAAQFYDAGQMAAQKITALASSSRYAVRDLFDLHHLFFTVLAEPEEVAQMVEPGSIEQAADKIRAFTHQDFKQQVLPYLTETLADLYRKPASFEKLQSEAEEALIRMMP